MGSPAHRRRRSVLARLYRVRRALARHDEADAALLIPVELRPEVARPILGRRALAALQVRLEEELAVLEAAPPPPH